MGVEEYGYVAPDPLDPDIVYGGKVTRFDRRTGQVQNVAPRFGAAAADYRVVRTMPILFSPVNPRKLYFASNVLWKTVDGGQNWTADQPRPHAPDLGGAGQRRRVRRRARSAQPTQRGVIYTIAPSYLDEQHASGWAPTTG